MNGSVKYRNRKFDITWTGEIAEHVADHFINQNNTHPYLHLEIQKMLQKSKAFNAKRSTVIAKCTAADGRKTYVIFVIKGKFAIIKTCYLYGWS